MVWGTPEKHPLVEPCEQLAGQRGLFHRGRADLRPDDRVGAAFAKGDHPSLRQGSFHLAPATPWPAEALLVGRRIG